MFSNLRLLLSHLRSALSIPLPLGYIFAESVVGDHCVGFRLGVAQPDKMSVDRLSAIKANKEKAGEDVSSQSAWITILTPTNSA